MMETASARFQIIQDTLSQSGNTLSVSYLCEIAGVSRSSYYNWLRSEEHRQRRKEQDRKDFEVIPAAYQFRGYKKGARSIYMRLLHQEPPVKMNIKKIRRLMEKFGLFCPVRRENPYRRMMKAMRTSHIAENLLNRDFTGLGARKVLLTDITYIPFHGSFYFFCIQPINPSSRINFIRSLTQRRSSHE